MKTNIIVLIISAGLFFLTGCDSSTTVTASKDSTAAVQNDMKMGKDAMQHDGNGLMASMKTMMVNMEAMKATGDFDIDFANMMIEHHQAAIGMSEVEIKSGMDDQMKAMAQKIITAQKDEQGKLRDIVKNNIPEKMDMGQGDALTKAMMGMNAQMSAMQMTGNTDKDFALMMIAHHEGAVKMFRDELSYGMKANLKQMATKGISDQTKEISEFKNWLAAQK